MSRGEEREREEEEEVVYNDQPESDQHFNLPRIQVIILIIMIISLHNQHDKHSYEDDNCQIQVNGTPDSLLDLSRLSQVSSFFVR